MSTTTPNLGLFKYNTSTDGKEVFSIQNALNNNWDIIDEKCGSGKNIGEIVVSTLPLTDAGLHLLDGSLIDGNGSYSQFVTYISGLVSGYPDLFTTEASWQEAVTNYGVCGKFVYDSTNNTVRLPKYSNKIYTQDIEQNTAPVVGNGLVLGLTDGNKNVGLTFDYNDNHHLSLDSRNYGVAYSTGSSNTHSYTENGKYGVTKDASKSGLIAQLSNITTSLDGYYYIVIATSTKTGISVDIDEIATDLNNKADLRDMAEVQCVVETYVSGTSWYRVYSDGWCEQGGCWSGSTGTTITLLKSFKDTNWTLTFANWAGTCWAKKSGTNQAVFHDAQNANSLGYSWIACGYIEV